MTDQIKNLLVKNFPKTINYDGNNFIEDGIFDSMDVMTLISLLENDFNIEIDMEDMVISNFANIENISNLIERKQNV